MRFDNASIVVYYCLIQMNIINLGILAHIDAGKTSVTENLLFASGATEKCGRVDNGDTITDSMDIEKRRGITVRASTTSIIWNGVKCNIIDTPGHMDFIAEVERTFKMLDGAVLILSAKEGIQAQTKLLFNTLQKLQIPTIIFINKIDRAGVNLERLYMDIKTNLSQDVLFMQTVVDGSVYPICSQTYIKEEYKEFVCNHDDDILERYLADSEISPADYWNTIIDLVAKAKVYPVLHGSATYPGANAETVQKAVITPLEEAINGVEDMTYMTSTASNTGDASIDIYFKQGTNADMAAVNVQNRVNGALSQLPAEATKTGVTTEKQQNAELMTFALYSPDDRFDQTFLNNYVKINVEPRLKRISGVGKAQMFGSNYSMRLWLRPDKMAQYGLIPGESVKALTAEIPTATAIVIPNCV